MECCFKSAFSPFPRPKSIVEFAKGVREKDVETITAAETAARLRFRAVMMTAISFLASLLLLVIAVGASAASRRSIGTTPVRGGGNYRP